MNDKYIKSPLNYTGGKYKLLPQIIPLFPDNINMFVDLFCGGANVGINVEAKKIICNDNITYLINLFDYFKNTDIDEVLTIIKNKINYYELSKTNTDGYNKLRNDYNNNRNVIDLFILTCYSFNHQIRFNNNHEFNCSFGKNRSSYNSSIEKNLISFINELNNKKIFFTNKDFSELKIEKLSDNDFVYCDPPYLITTGSYNDGNRGFKDWNINQEKKLLNLLDELNNNNIKFALSNVLENKGEKNDILISWSKNYNIHYLNHTYGNCNYHAKDKSNNSTVEVLITNY